MIPGKVLFFGEEILTDWFPRGGDNIIMRAQVIDRDGTVGLEVYLVTKNEETTGEGSIVKESNGTTDVKLATGTSSTAVTSKIFSSAATGSGANKGILEMVRYKLKVTGGSTGNSLTSRLFPPIFFDAGQ